MGDSLKSNSSKGEVVEKESNILPSSNITEIHPLAFTIEFDDQKYDKNKKSKVQERLNAFALKHRRNPSLPDFREVKNVANCTPMEKIDFPVYSQPMLVLHTGVEKCGKIAEPHWKSTALKTAKNMEFKTFSLRENLGMKNNFLKSQNMGRRYSLDNTDGTENTFHNKNLSNIDSKAVEDSHGIKNDDMENKSDTVSEAGTYTVDKDEEEENNSNKTHTFEINEIKENVEYLNGMKRNNHRNWITDWVRDVEEQNLLNPALKETPSITFKNLENPDGFCGISKIPSSFSTLGRKAKPRSIKPGDGNKYNGSVLHRRSSSLSAKDFSENQGSESSLETESFLKTTESVVTSMQNRMKFSFERRSPDLRRIEKRNFNYKERPHPPSTASDTDTNSENDTKTFKKPIGNPFTSTRLNRAFSLRRAKADPEKESNKTKQTVANNNETNAAAKQGVTSKVSASKPPSSIPFSRLDCGRFSMRSTISNVRANLGNQVQKKEMKKSNGGNRSTSSLSSREVEFQNWRRRKSFDPMKAAAEGRKKELAKKAAINQSVSLGSDPRTRTRTRHSHSSKGNPVFRSASFHSTAQVMGGEESEGETFQEQGSADEQESASFHFSIHHSRFHNSSSQLCMQCKPAMKTPVLSSGSSLVSETHSSPSRRLRTNDLEDLVLSAINEASYKLKLKSLKLLKKLNYLYDAEEEKFIKLKDEITVLESGQNFTKNSSVQQTTSRDLSAILKNLKGVEHVFRVLEDVLFHDDVGVNVNK